MREETFDLEADDGVRVHVYRWLPDDEPKAVIHVAHGLAEHAARYARFAAAATERGYVLYAQDHRGHGKTARDESQVGHLADQGGWDLVIGDLKRLHDHIGETHPELGRLLLGHSLGSSLGQHFLFRHSSHVDAAVFSGPSAHPGVLGLVGTPLLRAGALVRGKRARLQFFNDLVFGPYNKAFKPNRTTCDWLSRDEVEVDKYVADDRCGFVISTQHWLDVGEGTLRTYDASEQRKVAGDTPLLFLGGERDPAGGEAAVRRLAEGYRKAGVTHVDTKLYPEGRHEMLNETNRDEVTADLLDWFDARLG